ncbi:MAG: class I SAM-dependent methyltransferase [Gammaproteobacteria bacterium]|nr:class I SAM-dependent methyltransferase [Gammaproteobacteria bacterium]
MTVSTFNKLAREYESKYFGIDTYKPHLDRLLTELKSHQKKVLDIACGPGNIMDYLAKTRPDLELVGIDLAEHMLELARRNVPSAQFKIKDCREMGDLGTKFDAAIFSFGLNYLSSDDVIRFFNSLNANLSQSGLLYLSSITGNPEGSGLSTSSSGERVFQFYRTPEQIVELIEAAGYSILYTAKLSSPDNASDKTEDLVTIARRKSIQS